MAERIEVDPFANEAPAEARTSPVSGPCRERVAKAIHEALGGDGWAYSNYGGDEWNDKRDALLAAADAALESCGHAQTPGVDLMQRVWANLYYNEEDAGNTFQQTLNEVVDWLAERNALPKVADTSTDRHVNKMAARGPDCACCEQQPRKDCTVPGCTMKDVEWAIPVIHSGSLQCLRCGTVDAFGPVSPEKK